MRDYDRPLHGLPPAVRRYVEAERGPGRQLSAEAEAELLRTSLVDLARKSIAGALMYPLLTAAAAVGSGLFERSPRATGLFVALLTAMAAYRVLLAHRIREGRLRHGDRNALRASMHAMGWVFSLFCAFAILQDGTASAGFFAIVLMVGFTLGGALILSQEGRHALGFTVGVLGAPLAVVAAIGPPHRIAIGVCFALCLVFVARISKILHREYWLAQIRRTILREQSDELAAARAAAERAVEVREEFLRNVSHEMRTPMNGVAGMLELASEADDLEEVHEFVEHARHSARSMMLLVEEILAFAGEIDGLPVRKEEFDPIELGRSVLDRFEQRAIRKGLTLSLQTGRDFPPRIGCDRARLRQLLEVLISNAVKFTARGSVELRLTTCCEQGQWRLRGEVEDTGIGIAHEHHEMIFEPFRQVDTGVARAYDGLGIGLPVARRLAEQLGGWLRVESEPGRGSCFSFEVSVQPARARLPVLVAT